MRYIPKTPDDVRLMLREIGVDSAEELFKDIPKDLYLKGYFRVDRKDLVSSQLSLIFSRELLRKSRKFRPLLKLLEKELTSLSFDFQLSGNLHAMNFQWLDSEIKQTIQEKMPDFFERRIERGIDAMIEAAPQ